MQRTRQWTQQRVSGLGFIAAVVTVISIIYYTFIGITFGPTLECMLEQDGYKSKGGWFGEDTVVKGPAHANEPIKRRLNYDEVEVAGIKMLEHHEACPVFSDAYILFVGTFMFIFHCFFTNLLLAFWQCMMTDPGVVPANWGFYMGDEFKRRRYCKMCNVWKPDRTHHCSICNRCILNMDHHCPWINNCVGFYNRKFFMQLLGYVYITVALVILGSVGDNYAHLVLIIKDSAGSFPDGWTCVKFFSFLLSVMLMITLTNFIRFHVKLVQDNFTTIENLEREEGQRSKYDIGQLRNWEQVFGENRWLWWIPFHFKSSRPIGDGVRWRVHYTRVVDDEEEGATEAPAPGNQQTSSITQPGPGATGP